MLIWPVNDLIRQKYLFYTRVQDELPTKLGRFTVNAKKMRFSQVLKTFLIKNSNHYGKTSSLSIERMLNMMT